LVSEDPDELARLFGVSKVTIQVGKPFANVAKVVGAMCDRCRNVKDDVEAVDAATHLCERCKKALGK
jgi:hypothetical protein